MLLLLSSWFDKTGIYSLSHIANDYSILDYHRRFIPQLHEYVSIENVIVFNENAMIVLHVPIVFVLFSYRFQPSAQKR